MRLRPLQAGRAVTGLAPQGSEHRRGPQNGEKYPQKSGAVCWASAVIWPHNLTRTLGGAAGAARAPSLLIGAAVNPRGAPGAWRGLRPVPIVWDRGAAKRQSAAPPGSMTSRQGRGAP